MDEHAGSAKGLFEDCDNDLKRGLWILERKGDKQPNIFKKE